MINLLLALQDKEITLESFDMKSLITLLLFVAHTPVFAKYYFDYSPKAKQAYASIMSLRFNDAQVLLKEMKASEPNNGIVLHLEDYMDFFKIYINEDFNEFKRLEPAKEKRIEQIAQGDSKSPYFLFLQADIRLHWALARLKFEDYWKAFLDINKAFALLEENATKFPDFMPNQKDLGILHAVVSSIPSGVGWITNLEGDLEKGKRELQQVIAYSQKHDFIFEQETYILYAYVMLQFGNDEDTAWRIINESKLDPKNSPTAAFVLANVAMRTGRNDKAIEILKNRPSGDGYYPFAYLDFLLGRAKQQRLDTDADIYFKKYLQYFKGQNFIKETYRRLAWQEIIKDNPQGYQLYMKEVNNKGYINVGADESALKEAQEGIVPHVGVLKSRLLFDGGYYQRAYNTLLLQANEKFSSTKIKLEYTYFLGRTNHQLKKYEDAIKYYNITIANGKSQTWYFACRAALEKGNAFATMKQYENARTAYEECLTIKPSEHRISLHQSAKSGLARLKGK